MMRPTWARLSNPLAAMPEGWDTPGPGTAAELPSAPPLSWRNSPAGGSLPQAVLPGAVV
ncbi:hypothetical protein RKD18_003194 [Streptomyces phaeoluteigriseus]